MMMMKARGDCAIIWSRGCKWIGFLFVDDDNMGDTCIFLRIITVCCYFVAAAAAAAVVVAVVAALRGFQA